MFYAQSMQTAKSAKKEEMQTNVIHLVSEPSKREIDSLKENNAIAGFSGPEANRRPANKYFFDLLWPFQNLRAIKRAQIDKRDTHTLLSTSKTPSQPESQRLHIA